MTPRRTTLAQRNAEAIADDPTDAIVPVENRPEVADMAAGERGAAPARGRRSPGRPASAGSVVLATTIENTLLNEARAAYLADWTNHRQYDTFVAWIAGVTQTYAALSPQQRADFSLPARPKEDGGPRTYRVPAGVRDRVEEAIRADQQSGRWTSTVSTWLREAIAYATERSRAENGGQLPTPPAQLPKRLR